MPSSSNPFRIEILDPRLPPPPEFDAYQRWLFGPDHTATLSAGSIHCPNLRTALSLRLGSNSRIIQYDTVRNAIVAKYNARYFGDGAVKDAVGNLLTPDTSLDAEWDAYIAKFLQYHLDEFRRVTAESSYQEPYGNTRGLANSARLALSAGGAAAFGAEDMANALGDNPGNPIFGDTTFGSTYVDANGNTQCPMLICAIPGLRRVAYNLEKVASNRLLGFEELERTGTNRFRGSAPGAFPEDEVGYSMPNGSMDFTLEQARWVVESATIMLHEFRFGGDDGPSPRLGWPDALDSKWPTPQLTAGDTTSINNGSGGSQSTSFGGGWRRAPWMFGLLADAWCYWLDVQERTSAMGRSADEYYPDVYKELYTNPFFQLVDALEELPTSRVHRQSWQNAGEPMYLADAERGGYESFRFQDRAKDWIPGGGGEGSAGNPTKISTTLCPAYAWAAKQFRLGNSFLGVAQDIARSDALLAVHDSLFANGSFDGSGGGENGRNQARPYLNRTGAGEAVNFKETNEYSTYVGTSLIYRLEAQGIDTGREWV